MFVYRANLSRTLMLVAALLSAAAVTGAFACEFRADVQAESYPTVQALRFSGRVVNLDRTDMTRAGTFVPSINVLLTPFLFHSGEHLDKAPENPIGREILNSFDPYELAFHDSWARPVVALIERIRRVE
jgi:hypothetical protein